MNRFFVLVLLSAGLLLEGCRNCPIVSCHTRKRHTHGGVTYRGQPLWKKQNPAVGEKIELNTETIGKRTNDKSTPLK